MGHFLAVSAFKTGAADAVCQAIAEYCGTFNVSCETADKGASFVDDTDAFVHVVGHGWVVVLWPNYFNVHDFPLCQSLSSRKQWVVATVHVYDGDYWEHLFLNHGEVLHKFSSWPDYHIAKKAEAERAKTEWKGDPTALAEFLAIPVESISRYMVHMPLTPPQPAKKKSFFSLFGKKPDLPPAPVQATKAYDDDHFDLEDFWVFTDFWLKLGIRYPDPPDAGVVRVLRLDERFGDLLPPGP